MESQPKDLRHFLEVLEEKWPGEVLRVNTGGKTFDLVLSADRPPAYAWIAKLSQTSPYSSLFGDNELPALIVVYLGFIGVIGALFQALREVA